MMAGPPSRPERIVAAVREHQPASKVGMAAEMGVGVTLIGALGDFLGALAMVAIPAEPWWDHVSPEDWTHMRGYASAVAYLFAPGVLFPLYMWARGHLGGK